MKLQGTHKFKASSSQVFNAILNPDILKNSIPNCNSIAFLDANHIQINVASPIPGLKGNYGVVVGITQRQDPHFLELQVQRQGRGGSINAVCPIRLTDEPDGALLSYDANADLEGPVELASNPIGQGIIKHSLGDFFKKLESNIQ